MENKKVLHIVTISFVIKHFFGQQFNYLNKKTNNSYYLACSPSADFIEWQKEFGYIPFEVNITREISPIKDLIAVFKLIKFIREQKFDYVVAHTPKGGMIGMIASYIAGVNKRIYFRHGIAYETSYGIKRNLLKNIERLSGFFATKVVNVSKGVEKFALDDYLNHKSKNRILNKGTCNGIDALSRFNPNSYEQKEISNLKLSLNIKDSDFVVGYVGRLVHDKGIDDLTEAWQKLNSYKNLKLLLVGPFEQKDSVSSINKELILSDKTIIHTDYVKDSAIYFNLMNVFILPTYREGFPTVSLEASSMNLPVIITKATGCEEAIIENETGIFINNNCEEIKDGILSYYNDLDLCKTHGYKGRDFVIKNFEQSVIWEEIYNQLGY